MAGCMCCSWGSVAAAHRLSHRLTLKDCRLHIARCYGRHSLSAYIGSTGPTRFITDSDSLVRSSAERYQQPPTAAVRVYLYLTINGFLYSAFPEYSCIAFSNPCNIVSFFPFLAVSAASFLCRCFLSRCVTSRIFSVLFSSSGLATGAISVYIPPKNQSLKIIVALIAGDDVRLLYRSCIA